MSALREILAIFGVQFDTTELKQGDKAVSGLEQKLVGLGKVVAAGFALNAIRQFVGSVLQESDALAKASAGLGLHARELQELEHAAGLSGVGVETLRSALSRLQKGAAEAADKGTGPASEAFAKLGVNLKNQDGSLRTTGELFTEAAGKIGALTNSTERAGIASDLFGKSYAPLIPLFLDGEDGIRALRGEVEELGFAFDEAFLKDAQEYNDNIDRLHKGIRGFGQTVFSMFLPRMAQMSGTLVSGLKRVVAFTRSHNLLESAVVALTLKGLLMLSRWLGPLGKAISLVSGALLKFALRVALPILLIDELITTFKGGDTLLRRFIDSMFGVGATDTVIKELSDVWRDFAEVVLPEIGPTVRALASDIAKSMGEALDWLSDRFAEFAEFVHGIWEVLPGPLKDVLAAIGDLFASMFAALGEQIDHLINKFIPLKDLFNVLDSDADADARARARAEGRLGPQPATGAPSTPGVVGQFRAVARVAGQAQAVAAQRSGTAVAPVSSTTNNSGGNTVQQSVNVTVPAGTPAAVGDAARRGAQAGVSRANKATLNAVAFRPG